MALAVSGVMVSADQVEVGGWLYHQETKGVKVLESDVMMATMNSLVEDEMDHILLGVY